MHLMTGIHQNAFFMKDINPSGVTSEEIRVLLIFPVSIMTLVILMRYQAMITTPGTTQKRICQPVVNLKYMRTILQMRLGWHRYQATITTPDIH